MVWYVLIIFHVVIPLILPYWHLTHLCIYRSIYLPILAIVVGQFWNVVTLLAILIVDSSGAKIAGFFLALAFFFVSIFFSLLVYRTLYNAVRYYYTMHTSSCLKLYCISLFVVLVCWHLIVGKRNPLCILSTLFCFGFQFLPPFILPLVLPIMVEGTFLYYYIILYL